MASNNTPRKKTKQGLLIAVIIMTSAFLGILVSWIMIQKRLHQHIITINSLMSTNPALKRDFLMQERSTLSIDAFESWKSWVKTSGIFQKASKKPLESSLYLKSSQTKKILYWNDQKDLSPLEEAGCPISNCQLFDRFDVANDLKTSEFDAIVFRYKNLNETDLPKERSSFQKYVLYERDSPLSHSDPNAAEVILSNFFNLTMTYRLDSDIIVPIGGWIEPKSITRDTGEHLKRYSRIKIAWIVDDTGDCRNSNSNTIELIKRLRSFNIRVDIIRTSDCSLLDLIDDCGRKAGEEIQPKPIKQNDNDGNRLTCRQKIAEDYAFYLAIEKELCLDYITEKFYSMLDYPIIPLVMDIHENYAKAAPPHSYINAIDFQSVHNLSGFLISLNENHHLYNQYFVWKNYFKVRRSDEDGLAMNHLCNLCAALHEIKHPKSVIESKHSYEDIGNWWVRKGICRRLDDFTMVEEVKVFQ